jgi:hypothetical protein
LESWHEALPCEKGSQDRNNQKQYHILLVGEKDCQKEPLDLGPVLLGQLLLLLMTKTRLQYQKRDWQGMAELKCHHRTLPMRNNRPLTVCPVDSSSFCVASQLLVCDLGKAEGPLLRVSLSGSLESTYCECSQVSLLGMLINLMPEQFQRWLGSS